MFDTLTKAKLAATAESLAAKDPDLRAILERNGPPPLWGREPGFGTLVRIILEQQVSLASAKTMYRRLSAAIGPLTPHRILASGTPVLRSLGVTRQKSAYLVNTATAVHSGRLNLALLKNTDDESVFSRLVDIKGIGPWSANIYLLMALRRPDVWPRGDIALASAVQSIKHLPRRPTQTELSDLADTWRPNRATAARMLWQHYLTDMPRHGAQRRQNPLRKC